MIMYFSRTGSTHFIIATGGAALATRAITAHFRKLKMQESLSLDVGKHNNSNN